MAVISSIVAGSTCQSLFILAIEKTIFPSSPDGSNFAVNSSFINLPLINRWVGSVITNGAAALACGIGDMKIKVKAKKINRFTALIHLI